MEKYDDDHMNNLIRWLSSLDLETSVTYQTLLVGRCIAEALHKIEPAFFNDDFLERVSAFGEEANWRVKMNNLHKIHRRLSEFYKDKLSTQLTEKWKLDFRNTAEESVLEPLSKLLELVMAAALLKPDNQHFVTALMNHPNEVQFTAMNIVQEVQSIMPTRSPITEDSRDFSPSAISSERSASQLASLNAKIDHLEKEKEILQQQVRDLRAENEVIATENEKLRLRVEELSESGNETESLRKQLRIAQSSKEHAQDSIYKVEAERDRLKEVNEQLMQENADLSEKVKDIAPFKTEYRRLKDELEEYRLRSHEYEKLSAQLDVYKAKLQEYASQKTEVKVLQEKLSTYMQSAISLEDEQRKNGVLKTQIESLRLENSDINSRLQDEIRRADKAEFECKLLADRVEEAEKDRDNLRREHRQLNEKILLNHNLSASSLHDETVELTTAPANLQERMMILEAENERLRLEGGEKMRIVKDEMNALAKKKAELETELRLNQHRVVDLEARLKEADECLTSGRSLSDVRHAELQAENERIKVQLAQQDAVLKEKDRTVELQIQERAKLEKDLEKANADLAAEKQKLIHYMEKARRVILDHEEQSQSIEGGSLSRHEFDSIRRERDTYKQIIETLKESMERSRAMQEQEQRLITTHAYYMMMQLAHGATSARDSSLRDEAAVSEKSFLSRQRQCGNINISSFLRVVLLLAVFYLLWTRNFSTLNGISYPDLPPS